MEQMCVQCAREKDSKMGFFKPIFSRDSKGIVGSEGAASPIPCSPALLSSCLLQVAV